MKIGIDISQIVYQGTGVAQYTRSLVEALLRVDQENEYFLFGSSFRRRQPLKEFVKNLKAKNSHQRFSFLPPKILEMLWNGVHLLPIESFLGEIDVFHSSDWLEPPTRWAKRVTTVHDLAVFKYPQTFFARGGHDIVQNQKRKLHFVKHYSDLVIAVSENTKKDLQEVLGFPEKKIKVIHEAADPGYFPRDLTEINETKEKFKLENNYLLCVGTREPRKNLEKVLLSFSEIASKNKDLSLVVVGNYGWGEDLKNILSSKVKLTGFVEKEDLARLYSGATAFLYPSLYEGFGLPILEAMACACPVITSNLGAMKEIAGGAALLVNPEEVNSLTKEIMKILDSQKLRQDLKIKGLSRAGEFSWERTALETLNAYHSLTD